MMFFHLFPIANNNNNSDYVSFVIIKYIICMYLPIVNTAYNIINIQTKKKQIQLYKRHNTTYEINLLIFMSLEIRDNSHCICFIFLKIQYI